MGIQFEEVDRELDMEFLLDRESIPYKHSRGVSGMQLHLRECPACGDTRWRTYINAETGRGNCFVCNEPFTKTSFVKHHFQVEWRDVGKICEEILREQGWRPKRMITAAVEIPDNIKLPYSLELPTPAGENLTYLEQRGVNGELAKYFHMRWCEFGWWDAVGTDGKPFQQRFDNRVIIPVFDLDGELANFQGRDLTGRSDRKYLFPIGLPGTGRFLLNGQNVHLTDEVVIGEGAFDVIAIKIALDGDVALRRVVPVGTFGKHLSYGSLDGNDQLGRFLQLKGMGLKKVTIMWDGEENAVISALEAAKLLTGIGLLVRIALLPFDKDPNEVLPEIVRDAYYKARAYTPALHIRWHLRNPYSARMRDHLDQS